MANVWLKSQTKCRYWIAQFRDERGVRVNRSTKQTDRRKAQKVADDWEELAIKARHGELTVEASRLTLNRMIEATGAGRLEKKSILEAFGTLVYWSGAKGPFKCVAESLQVSFEKPLFISWGDST